MSTNSNNDNNDFAVGCIVYALIAVIAMPFLGLYMIAKGNQEQKGIGILLTIVGIIIWIYFGIR